MDILSVIIISAIVLLLFFFLTLYFYMPLRKIRNDTATAKVKVNKDFKNKEHHEIITIMRYHLFDDSKMQNKWEKYFKVVSSSNGNHKFTDINDYFNPQGLIDAKINRPLALAIPFIFFLVASSFTFLFEYFAGIELLNSDDPLMFFICCIILLSVIMAVIYKNLLFKAVAAIDDFNLTVSEIFETPYGTGAQISDIRMILGRYHSDQLKLYSKLNKEVSLTVVQKLEPFLDAMEKMVRDYLSAISIDQQKAMENLADYFMKNTSELYDGQLEKITDATMKMTQIQEKTSGSLENISEFFNSSAVAIDKVINNSKEMSDSYEKYLSQMKDMSLGIDENIKLMVQMLEYIDENAKNKDFTIEKLTSFQQELISTSESSAVKMQEFFNDFKESYTNHLHAVKSVSESLQNSGITIESSYKDFNNSLGDISGFFESLKNGMDDVRNNTNELSSVYKENLEQLQSVNKLVEDNINSSSNLTEYINNSLKSNNFTIEKLTEFQKELIDVSDRSSSAMNEFFTDFKDHYSSYIVAMKAASADMQKSGEIVKDSYSGFATNLDREVSEVFAKFEDNLSEISIRFARSIKDLQDAIDELPGILKGIK